jgi:hypothetical protein
VHGDAGIQDVGKNHGLAVVDSGKTRNEKPGESEPRNPSMNMEKIAQKVPAPLAEFAVLKMKENAH